MLSYAQVVKKRKLAGIGPKPLPSQSTSSTCNCLDFNAIANFFSISELDLIQHPPSINFHRRNDSYDLQLGTGLTTFSIQGDGNCLFRAVSRFLFGHENFHVQIRSAICAFMSQNSPVFQTYVNGPFDDYLQIMSKTDGSIDSWGTHTEIFALATMIQADVYVFSEYGGRLTWNRFFPLQISRSSSQENVTRIIPYIMLCNVSGSHYETVFPKPNICLCQLPPPNLHHNSTTSPLLIDLVSDNDCDSDFSQTFNSPEAKKMKFTHSPQSSKSNLLSVSHSSTSPEAKKLKLSHSSDHIYCIPLSPPSSPSSPPKFEFPSEIDHTYCIPSSPPSSPCSPPKFKSLPELDHNYCMTLTSSIESKLPISIPKSISPPILDHIVSSLPDTSIPLSPKIEKKSLKRTQDHSYSATEGSKVPTKCAKFSEEIVKAPNIVCFSCHKLFYPSPSLKSIDFDKNPDIALLLSPLFSESTDKKSQILCGPCLNSLKKKKIPPQSRLNNLQLFSIPAQLRNLNPIEQRLISQVHAYMKLIILPYGQQAMNGQMINFPYDIEDMMHNDHSDSKFLVVSTESAGEIPKEFIADLDKVRDALSWLKMNNPLYSDISSLESRLEHPETHVIYTSSDSGRKCVENHEGKSKELDLIESSVCLDDPIMSKTDFTDMYPTKSQKKLLHSEGKKSNYKLPINRNKPINIYSDCTLEERAFPNLFPTGKFGLLAPRKYPITHLKYFQARLMSVDRRFSSHLPYLFWATNVHEKKLLSDSISIAMRMRSSKTAKRNTSLTVNEVVNDLGSNPDLPENYFGYMKNIRGSGAYWNGVQLDLLAMIKNFGPPTWFLTLSANDMNWFDLMQVLCNVNDLPSSLDDVKIMPKSQKVKLMNKNPITTAKHFSRRFHHFVQKVILGESQPIGVIERFFWRVEFQMRGSPHIHSLWWVENAPDIRTEEGKQALPEFVDKYVSCKLPSKDEDPELRKKVQALQVHEHSHTCKKFQGKSSRHANCRFDYPQCVSEFTVLKEDLLRSSKCYTLKRAVGEEYINPYNPTLLLEWNANMDIQFVGGVYGAAKYICSYVCKRESDQIRQALSEVRKNLSPDCTMRQKLMKIGNVFLTHRQLSAQEAAYKMCGLPLKAATNQVLYLDTRPKDLRTRILKPSVLLNDMDLDCTSIFVSSIHDRYINRPLDETFKQMSLYDFARWYNKCDSKEDGTSKTAIPLENGMGFIKRRTSPLVVRSNKTTPELHGDVHYLSKMIMYFPWRTEEDLTRGFSSAKEAFESKSSSFTFPDTEFGEVIEQAVKEVQQLNDCVVKDYIAPIVAPNIECVDNDLELPLNNTFQNSVLEIDSIPEDTTSEHTQLYGDEISAIGSTRMTDTQFDSLRNSLNEEQRLALDFVQKHSTDLQLYQNGSSAKPPEPYHLFISGAGGSGKSYLISAIVELIRRMFPVDDGSSVITTAPTGVAAFNINGVTIHRALGLPIQHGKSAKFKPLTGERLKLMRQYWKYTNTVIVDEISMVSYDVLLHVNLRLNEIKGITNPNVFFGGLNFICVGDFFQLPPVHGLNVFSANSIKACGTHLWKDLFHLIELKTVVRQSDDTFITLLNRVRTGDVTSGDIDILLSLVTKVRSVQLNDPATLFLFPTLKQCDVHNTARLKSLSEYATVHTIKCVDKLMTVDRQGQYTVSKKPVDPSLIPEDDRECAGLARSLSLAKGAVIMLRRNIDTLKGLVNGARGVITGFSFKSVHRRTIPTEVFVEFFTKSVGDSSEPICITPFTAIFYGKNNSIIQRTQFPLTLSWACTIHKVQGLTLDKAVIDLGPKIFTFGMAYVALGRVKSLEGVQLLDFSPKAIKASRAVHEEMERLRNKQQSTLVEE
jgi:hypothetical protein